MPEPAAVTPRCSKCGYQRPDRTVLRCSECGDQSEPLQPMSRAQIRRDCGRHVSKMLLNAAALIIPTLIGWLAVKTDAIPLFMCGAMLMVIVFPIACLIVAVGLSLRWTPWLLLAWWSRRGGDVGPWSGRSKHVLAFVSLLTAQLLICGAVAGLALASFPDYPGGWP